MSNKHNSHHDHPAPVTRRDFLSRGLMTYSTIAFAPTMFGMIAKRAYGFQQGTQGGAGAMPNAMQAMDAGFMPFMVVDLVGGWGAPGSFLVGGKGGAEDMIKSYSNLGWNPKTTSLDKRFGAPMAGTPSARPNDQPISKFLQGMITTMSAEAQAKFRLGTICHQGQDDSSNNNNSALLLASKAGSRGTQIDKALGMSDTLSGANTQVPVRDASLKPIRVESVDSLVESLGYGSIASDLPKSAIEAIFNALGKLSGEQVNRLKGQSGAAELGILTSNGYVKNIENLANQVNVDPRREQLYQSVFGINANTDAKSREAVSATIAMNVIQGISGPGVIQMGGYDYHNNGLASTDNLDLQAGQMIGRLVETAHRLKKPFFVQILTDGGVTASSGSRDWSGDSGDKSMTVIGYYNPEKAPELRRTQLGYYEDGQGASRDSIIGADTNKVAVAVFANYLAACGKLDKFTDAVPSTLFQINGTIAQSVDDLLIFG